MQLLVIRHAIAVDASDADDDAGRKLTRQGRRRFRRAARGLDRLGLTPAQVLHSPKRRAVETAALLDAPSRISEHLAGPPRAELYAELAALGDVRAAVVGHEPYLGALIATLTLGDPRHGEAITLKKGGVAWLDGSPTPGGMHLRALLPPKILRRVS